MNKQIARALVALGVLLIGTCKAHAQANAVVKIVNLKIADVISIDAGAAINGVIDFNYVTSSDYSSSKNVTVANSLVITSSKNFDVKVKAGGVNFLNGSDAIPVNVLKIRAVAGGTMGGVFKTITLSTADKKLVRSAPKGMERSLNIEYSITAAKASSILLGKPAGTYKQTITYTATAI